MSNGTQDMATRRFVAMGDMDKLGACEECGDVAFWVAVEETDDGHEVVPFCGEHRPEVEP